MEKTILIIGSTSELAERSIKELQNKTGIYMQQADKSAWLKEM